MRASEVFVQEIRSTGEPVWIEIEVSALFHNLQAIRKLLSEGVEILAVVKANAYGHGLIEIAKILSPEVHSFGVYSLLEVYDLREAGTDGRILLLGPVFGPDIVRAIELGATLSVSSSLEAEAIEAKASALGRKANIHIHVDTGMARLGIRWEEAEPEILRISRLPHLFLEGIYTHFASASDLEDTSFPSHQISIFRNLLDRLARAGLEFPFVHAANSAGLIRFPEAQFNMVRPGLALYGIDPFCGEGDFDSLEPALSLKSRWVHFKRIRGGETVGYGRSYCSPQDTVIGVLPVGYSHGYPFQLSGKGRVLFHGQSYPVVGTVNMDQMMVDLGKDSEAELEAPVTLIGRDGKASIPAGALAREIGSIPHEITTRLHPRIPRIYL